MIRKAIGILVIMGLAGLLPAQTAHRYLREGNGAYSDGNFTAAEEAYRKALEAEQNLQAVYNLGNALLQQGRLKEALSRYERVAEMAEEEGLKADAHYNLGHVYFQMKQYQKSMQAFKAALLLRPKDQSAKYNYAQAERAFVENAPFDLALKLKPRQGDTEEEPPETKAYDITIVNEGKLPAREVGVVNYIPKGLDMTDPNWKQVTESAAQYRGSIPAIPPGDSVTISLSLKVRPGSKLEERLNAVEISQARNRWDKKDIDSTPLNANEKPQEDDFGKEPPSNQQQPPKQQQQQKDEQEEQPKNEQQPPQQPKEQDQSSQEQKPQSGKQQPPSDQQQEGNPQEGGKKKELSPEEARRLLKIIEEEELQVMEKLKKQKGQPTKSEKDW
jgi:tetratricopeptide (TPR) repeat protein